jgi:hypothetical protein
LSPTSKYTTLTHLELQSALAFYLGERIPLLPNKCNCKSKTHLDPFGNHSIICKTGGGPIRRHDSIKYVMHGMFTQAGVRCSVEDKHQFKKLHPSDNTRADLTARGFGNMGQDLLMDFCCYHPGSKSYLKKKNIAKTPGLIFPSMEKKKNKMYLAKANELNITFMPMASDVYGSMSITFLSVLSKVAEMINETRNIPLHQVAKHWIQRISFAIYKSHSDTFSDKRVFVNGANNRAQDHSAFRKCVIDDTTEF